MSSAPADGPSMLSVPSAEEQEKQRAYKEQQIKFYKAEAQKAKQANVTPGSLNIPEQWWAANCFCFALLMQL